jgi:hypothetical protein
MRTLSTLIVASALVLALGCSKKGDNPNNDADNADSPVDQPPPGDAPPVPPAPAIGAQIDRMGRPVINTALVALGNTSAADTTTMKDNYNHASNPATWATTTLITGVTVVDEFKTNLALLDALDTGLVNGGCKNQLLYNGVAAGGGTPAADSYQTLAGILADDRLYVDTTKKVCGKYLNVELDVATGGTIAHTDCGGRAPTNDVGDASYSVLLGGLNGFSTDGKLTPLITDGGGATKVTLHLDTTDLAFPFLGPPTNP